MCQHPHSGVSSQSSRRMRINRDQGVRQSGRTSTIAGTQKQGSINFQAGRNRTAASHTTSECGLKGRRPACQSPKSHPCPPKQMKMKPDALNNNGQERQMEVSLRSSPVKQAYPAIPVTYTNDQDDKVRGVSHSPKPTRGGSPADRQAVPLLAYAGAKFSDPPSPKVLPKPPVHWVSCKTESLQNNCAEMSNILKVMLKVHA